MQIDFHHAVTWIVARASGFNEQQAEIIAYAAQYVNDATNTGTINFTNGAQYHRAATAHKMLDYTNVKSLQNSDVWLPFHFLPGNGGLPAGIDPDGGFIRKLVCTPNSHIAKDVVHACIQNKNKPYALHQLGITAHVLADTWGHQGFAGVNHGINKVTKLYGAENKPADEYTDRVVSFFKGSTQDEVPYIGHGQALSYPDLPYEKWSYTNQLGDTVVRINPLDFLEAADELSKVFKKYLQGDFIARVTGLDEALKNQLVRYFIEFNDANGTERHLRWLHAIEHDYFGLGATTLNYIAKGKNSWKHQALFTEQSEDLVYDTFEFTDGFLISNWKYFHDAAKQHRLTVVDEILPRYGICVA